MADRSSGHKQPFIHPFPIFSAIMSTSEPPSKRIMLMWSDDSGPSAPTVVSTVAELLHRLEALPYINIDLDNAESLVTAAPSVSELLDNLKTAPCTKAGGDDETPRTAVPMITASSNSRETVPYIFTTEGDAETPACTDDGGISVWSMHGQYFYVPNDPKEMFLFFRGLFDNAYSKAVTRAPLSARQLALLHGAPSLLGTPSQHKASATIDQENRVQPRVRGSTRQLTGPPSIRQASGPPSVHQPARPPGYRQVDGPSSVPQPVGQWSAHQPTRPPPCRQPAGLPPSASQAAGPSSAFAFAYENRGGAKRTRPAPSVPFRRDSRYQVIPPSLDLGDFTSVEDACRTLQICHKVIKGKYLEGLITFDGRYSQTEQARQACETCTKYRKPCNLLVGGKDRHVTVSGCGACTQRGLSCSLKQQVYASYRRS
ncbi:hypothetical protein DFP73DRAFT_63616 [Morchella snyderi]|nr:hypothetical protein DFP73DRAFT_63616 [Morchella snyderi]